MLRALAWTARGCAVRTATAALAAAHQPRPRFVRSSSGTSSGGEGDRYDKGWSELPLDEQRHWKALGWDEQSWEDDNGAGVRTEAMSWDELSGDEKRAARMLGFDEESWDDDFWYEMSEPLTYMFCALIMICAYISIALLDEHKWTKTKVGQEERNKITQWVKSFADSYTDATWEGKDNYGKTLDESAVAIMTGMRDMFLQLAEDEEPRHIITRNSWLKHTDGAASGHGRQASLALFKALDVDRNDQIDFNEFAKFTMLMVVGRDPRIDSAAFAELLFVMIDQDCNGELTESEVDGFLELARCAGVQSFDGLSARDLFDEAVSQTLPTSEMTAMSKQVFVMTVGPKLAGDFAENIEPELVPKELTDFRSTWISTICNGKLATAWRERYVRSGGMMGGGGGCFAPGTQVITPQGAVSIEDLRPGDETVSGGRVKATLQFDLRACAPLFDYKGVIVTGDHAVQNDEHRFVRVGNAIGASRLVDMPSGKLVHDLITTDHRIPCVCRDGRILVFADYEEVHEGEEEYKVLLGRLNKENYNQ